LPSLAPAVGEQAEETGSNQRRRTRRQISKSLQPDLLAIQEIRELFAHFHCSQANLFMLTAGGLYATSPMDRFHCPQANLFMLTVVYGCDLQTVVWFPLPSGKSLHADAYSATIDEFAGGVSIALRQISSC
jgi:hypothetical protein